MAREKEEEKVEKRPVGRPPLPDSGVSHLKREDTAAKYPVHVAMKIDETLPSLRTKRAFEALLGAFRGGCDRNGFRLIHYSVRSDELQLIVEAKNRSALSRGLQGLSIRIARALSSVWGRKGSVFADRYDDRVLRTPEEVHEALGDVFEGIDRYSSARYFDGWRGVRPEERGDEVVEPRTALLRTGWRKCGLLSVDG
ncbi:MAG: hypothetical protein GY711_28220 [bacterium]|nr:hypothetical protein [bacterium]